MVFIFQSLTSKMELSILEMELSIVYILAKKVNYTLIRSVLLFLCLQTITVCLRYSGQRLVEVLENQRTQIQNGIYLSLSIQPYCPKIA